MTADQQSAQRLTAINAMSRDANGVWSKRDQPAFDYSDGAAAEKWLEQTFRQSTDLSVMSEELDNAIIDWPSEYHLSYERGNLLRALDLSGVQSVLEVGCGCGAVTRYLGEQGFEVDSLEGDQNRARLAALRVADLPNVQISCANFNDLTFPEKHYDLVLFVGVLEYAARFRETAGVSTSQISAQAGHRQAIIDILKISRKSLKPDGVAVTAIENRLGLKYLLGVREDHYGTPYEGMYNYPNDSGIRTFERPDWREFSTEVGFDSIQFLYPFPDYKLPRVVVSDHFLNNYRHAAELLHGMHSRDYVAAVAGLDHEEFVRDGVAQSGHLGDFANSFLMVMGDGAVLSKIVSTDFVHVSGRGRQPRYRTITSKAKGADTVQKQNLLPTSQRAPDVDVQQGFLRQQLDTQQYTDGERLSRCWLKLIRTRNDLEPFQQSLRDYREFLEQRFATEDSRHRAIDALASNILIDADGNWHVIDLEWETAESVSIDFVVFRCLFYFFIDNPDVVRTVGERTGRASVADLIRLLCQNIGVLPDSQWQEWISLEDQFQSATSTQRLVDIKEALSRAPSAQQFSARVYWSLQGEPTTDDRMRVASGWEGGGRQTLQFKLPSSLTKFKFLRFDPTEERGYFHLYRMRLCGRDQNGEMVELLCWRGGQQIRDAVDLIRIDYGHGGENDVFVALDEDPIIHIDLEEHISEDIVGGLVFQVDMDCPRSRDYRVMADRFLGDIDRLELKVDGLEEKLRIIKDAELELNEIKNSRVWRLADRVRYLFYKRIMSKLPMLQNLFLRMSRSGIRNTVRRLLKGEAEVLKTAGEGAAGAVVEAEVRHSKYDEWREKHELSEADRDRYRDEIRALSDKPLISVVMPVYNVDAVWLERAINSVRYQLYENWELIIVDDNSDNPETRKVLDWLSVPGIHLRHLDKNRNISGATNEGIRMASGRYIAFLDHDDELAENALAEVALAIVSDNPDAIYTDEDFVTLEQRHVNPHFKTDYSPDLLLSHNYITHLSVVRRSLVDDIGGMRSEFDGAQDYDFWLRVAEKTDNILHIPKVLYHWRMVESSTSLDAEAKPAALAASKLALEESLARRGENAEVLHGNIPYFFRVKRAVVDSSENTVSIIIPFKDKPDLLESSIGNILKISTYENFEIIGISNNSERDSTFATMRELESRDSRVRFLEHNQVFNFSELTNIGVAASRGRFVSLVNNDVEIINWDWIECLLEHAQRGEVGVVGGKLYYPDNTVQHAGIIVGIGGYAGHPHKHFNSRRSGYFNRASIQHNLSAVTGAFMMFRREVFDAVNGFDQDALKVACNDVDFCLRVREQDLLNVFTPYAHAYHHESLSRGYEDTPEKKARFEAEKKVFQHRHHQVLDAGDPYYNPNLALDNEHFGIQV